MLSVALQRVRCCWTANAGAQGSVDCQSVVWNGEAWSVPRRNRITLIPVTKRKAVTCPGVPRVVYRPPTCKEITLSWVSAGQPSDCHCHAPDLSCRHDREGCLCEASSGRRASRGACEKGVNKAYLPRLAEKPVGYVCNQLAAFRMRPPPLRTDAEFQPKGCSRR